MHTHEAGLTFIKYVTRISYVLSTRPCSGEKLGTRQTRARDLAADSLVGVKSVLTGEPWEVWGN